MHDLQYPIGEFEPPAEVSRDQIEAWIREIERLPAELRALVEPLSPGHRGKGDRRGEGRRQGVRTSCSWSLGS